MFPPDPTEGSGGRDCSKEAVNVIDSLTKLVSVMQELLRDLKEKVAHCDNPDGNCGPTDNT